MEQATHCNPCGVLLEGGATRHKADCPWRDLIADAFPQYKQPPPPDEPTQPALFEHAPEPD
jgi:hypothetical protein